MHARTCATTWMLALAALATACAAAVPDPACRLDLGGRDLAVAPGDDFEAWANGAWRARAVIPPDRASTGIWLTLLEVVEQRTLQLVTDADASGADSGSIERLVADYYAAFLDEATIEARGVQPLRPWLDEVAAVADKGQLARLIGRRLRADVDPLNATELWTENLFGLFVAQAPDDPSVNVPYLLQGGLGLPDREYYLSDQPALAEARARYEAYVAHVLGWAGLPDGPGRAARVVALEARMAAVHASVVDSQDVHEANNPWTPADFVARAPGFDWPTFLAAAGLDGAPRLIAWQPTALTGLAALVGSEPLDTWKDWLAFHTVNHVARVLPQVVYARSFDLYGRTLTGTPEPRPRWKRALDATSEALGDAVGQLYVKRWFPPQAREQVRAMAANLVTAFGRRIDALAWMTPATRAKARAKLATLRVGVGYPDTWRDYRGLEIRRDDALGNLLRAEQAELRHQLARVGRPVDRDEWWMAPQVVNALNLPLQNALNFPAAILLPPFFDPAADPAENYGSIGAIIGHEISHSFDNLGAEFDAEGRLANWWTPDDAAHFDAAAARLVAQYDAYEPLPGLHVNGRQTLAENIADTAGLAAAFDAWRLSLGDRPAPVVAGLTGEQRFFLAFAQSWRSKMREPALRQRLLTDGHAPARWRALTVRNLDAWYAAYDVQPEAALYLAPSERVKVW
jgi:putative endopeptidase